MKKTIKQIMLYLFISSILLFSLAGCSQTEDGELLKEKIDKEIDYLDTRLLEMLNKTNGISFKNYAISAEQVNQEQSTKSDSKSEGTSEEKSNSSSQGESQSSNSNSTSSSGEKSDKNYMNYKMELNTVLTSDKTPDWKTLSPSIETLYSSWSTIVLDLYKININSDDILNFEKDLDITAQAIKKQDKNATLTSLAKLYSYLPKYLNSFSADTTKTNIIKTKSSVLNAYAIIEQNKPDEVKKEITNAEQAYMPIINNIEANQHKQFNINKAYILLKELQSAIDIHDTDIFYIKYRNLIEELNMIQK